MGERVAVFGLGYVGCVTAGCVARAGHSVVAVDVLPEKVRMVNDGMATVLEPGLDDLVKDMVRVGRLRASDSVAEAVRGARFSLVCVGSPGLRNGSLDASHVERVCGEIGVALATHTERHVVVIRSTVLPGTLEARLVPVLERASGKKAGVDFDVCLNPEFLRTGCALDDYLHPSLLLIGTESLAVASVVRELYADVEAPVRITSPDAASMMKYASNCWRAVKVTFANEIGSTCQALGLDGQEVMRLFCEDDRLNLSAAYLRPGFAFGGSCLTKDLRALAYRARQADVATPLLAAALESNRAHVARAFDLVARTGRRRVGVLGMAFKAGTDDLRESPAISLIEMLIGKGYDLQLYDADVRASRLLGANRAYIEREIPHLWTLVRPTVDEVLAASDVVVIANGAPEFRDIGPRLRKDHIVIDLVRALEPTEATEYRSLCW